MDAYSRNILNFTKVVEFQTAITKNYDIQQTIQLLNFTLNPIY